MYILHLTLKIGPDRENSHKYLPFGKKGIVKIGPVDTEITLLILKIINK